jgi:hypothetical protein
MIGPAKFICANIPNPGKVLAGKTFVFEKATA